MVALSLCISGIIWNVAIDDWNNLLSIFLNNLCLILNACSGKHRFWPVHFWRLSHVMPFCFFQLELYRRQNNQLLDFYFFVSCEPEDLDNKLSMFLRFLYEKRLSPSPLTWRVPIPLLAWMLSSSCRWRTDKCTKEILLAPSYTAVVWGRSTCYSNTMLSLFSIHPWDW